MIADGKERFRELGRTGSADHRGERNKKSRMGARERERERGRYQGTGFWKITGA